MRELFLTSLPRLHEKSTRHLRQPKPALILQPQGDIMSKDTPPKKLRDRPLSDRPLKKWSVNTWNVAFVFCEFPEREFSQKELYHILRTWHLNNPGSDYSEDGIRAVLRRFTKKGYLIRRRLAGRRSAPLFRVTDHGHSLWSTMVGCHGRLVRIPRLATRLNSLSGHGLR